MKKHNVDLVTLNIILKVAIQVDNLFLVSILCHNLCGAEQITSHFLLSLVRETLWVSGVS